MPSQSFIDEDYHQLSREVLLSRITHLQTLLAQQSQRYQSTEEALHDSNLRLQAVLATVTDAVITIDRHGIIQSVNPATTRLFGYASEELLGQNVSLLMPSPHQERHGGYLQRYLRTGEPHIIGKGREIVGRRKDGSLFPADIAVSELHDGELYFTGIIRDLSERKESEEHLRVLRARLEQMSRYTIAGELGAMLAHEINQPLMTVITYAQISQHMLKNSTPNVEQLVSLLDKVVEQSKRAGDIIRRLRGLIRKTDPSFGAVPVNDAAQEILHLLAQDFSAHHIVVHTHLAEALPAVHGDRIQIQQVLVNLLRNSIDALKLVAPDQRELTLTTALHDADDVQISIADSGAGLTPEIKKHLFQPFFTTKLKGIGLGLAVCQSIIESHEGRLWADSIPDHGAVFHFTLPAILRENLNGLP